MTAAVSRLHEDVEYVAICVDRPPQPVSDAIDFEDDLVEMPPVGCRGPVASDLRSELRSKLPDPDPDRLVGDNDPALSVARGGPWHGPD